MGVNAAVDTELCIGSMECNRIAPEAFRLEDESGVSVVLDGAAETDEGVLLRAAETCPTQAIRLARADGSLIHDSAS